MRTTVDIADPVLKDLKRLSQREGRSLGSVASDLLAQALAAERRREQAAPAFRWATQPMRARVDLADRDALYDALDRSPLVGRQAALSFAIDVNVLLYAADEDCSEHARASAFVHRCAAEGQVFCIAWVTLMSFLRLATHPSIFDRPLPHAVAAANVDALIGLPHLRVIGEDEGFWSAYAKVAGETPLRGNLVPDAHLVALLRRHGVKTLYTRDRDFRKFAGLTVRDPLA